MILETKKLVEAEITERRSGHTGSYNRAGGGEEGPASSEEVIKAEVNALNDLLNEATLSLAKILHKQGCVSSKFGNHYQALVRCWNIS